MSKYSNIHTILTNEDGSTSFTSGQSFSTGAAITTLASNSHAVFKWIGAVSKWFKVG